MTPVYAPEVDLPIDCGTAALYFYLKIEKIDVDLHKLMALFPVLPADGHSFATIENVATNFGIVLDGVKLTSIPADTHGPMIVHSNYGPKGHFVVLNPIKNHRDVVMVLDAISTPRIVEKSAFCNSSEWSGFALMRRQRHDLHYCLIALGFIVCAWVSFKVIYVPRSCVLPSSAFDQNALSVAVPLDHSDTEHL